MPNQTKNILLISLINSTDNIGLKYLNSALLSKGYSPNLLFYTSDDRDYFGKIAGFAVKENFDVVGVSLMSRFFEKAAGLSAVLRSELSGDVPVVWGGTHPTIDPDGCKKYADYVCVGEAENVIDKFVDGLDGKTLAEDVTGFSSPGGDNSACPSADDLDALSFPDHFSPNSFVTDGNEIREMDLRLFKNHSRYKGTYMSVMTIRGCSYNCSYCCNKLLKEICGKKIRKRSPQNVIEEIELNLSKTKIAFNYIHIVDDCFALHNSDWLRTFVELYRGIGVPITFRATPQLVTEEKIKILRDAPCGFALVGLQSGSARVNREIYNRRYSREAFLKCARTLHRNSIPAMYDIIVDNPYETKDDFKETVDVVGELPSSSYFFYFSLTFYKNTELYEKAKADGYDVDAHLTKSQGDYDKMSRENKLLRLSLFFSKKLIIRLLEDESGFGNLKINILTKITTMFLEPVRFFKLSYLSQQRRKLRFLRLLASFAKEFFVKINFEKRSK